MIFFFEKQNKIFQKKVNTKTKATAIYDKEAPAVDTSLTSVDITWFYS